MKNRYMERIVTNTKLKQRHRKGGDPIWNRGIERDCGKNRIEIEAHGQFS
jgi:hypothetical protein